MRDFIRGTDAEFDVLEARLRRGVAISYRNQEMPPGSEVEYATVVFELVRGQASLLVSPASIYDGPEREVREWLRRGNMSFPNFNRLKEFIRGDLARAFDYEAEAPVGHQDFVELAVEQILVPATPLPQVEGPSLLEREGHILTLTFTRRNGEAVTREATTLEEARTIRTAFEAEADVISSAIAVAAEVELVGRHNEAEKATVPTLAQVQKTLTLPGMQPVHIEEFLPGLLEIFRADQQLKNVVREEEARQAALQTLQGTLTEVAAVGEEGDLLDLVGTFLPQQTTYTISALAVEGTVLDTRVATTPAMALEWRDIFIRRFPRATLHVEVEGPDEDNVASQITNGKGDMTEPREPEWMHTVRRQYNMPLPQ